MLMKATYGFLAQSSFSGIQFDTLCKREDDKKYVFLAYFHIYIIGKTKVVNVHGRKYIEQYIGTIYMYPSFKFGNLYVLLIISSVLAGPKWPI